MRKKNHEFDSSIATEAEIFVSFILYSWAVLEHVHGSGVFDLQAITVTTHAQPGGHIIEWSYSIVALRDKKHCTSCVRESLGISVQMKRDAKYTEGKRHVHLSMHALKSRLLFLKDQHESLLISTVVCYSIASALNLDHFKERESLWSLI